MDDYILIVDDDPDVRLLLSEVLRLFGLRGRNAHDGREALQIVREAPPVAILLDVMMPVLDGFSTLTMLQRGRAERRIPIILLSGLDDSAQRLKRLPGVAAVLRKGDFSLDRFRTVLAQAGIQLH